MVRAVKSTMARSSGLLRNLAASAVTKRDGGRERVGGGDIGLLHDASQAALVGENVRHGGDGGGRQQAPGARAASGAKTGWSGPLIC